MSNRPFRHLCPEADKRDAMTDDEFWAYVADTLCPEGDYDDTADPLDVALAQDICGECGEIGACAWDSEGRPLIHAPNREDEA